MSNILYSLSSDFNSLINTTQLKEIISENTLFTSTVSIITIVNDIVNIVFNQDLSIDETTYLNNIVSNYVYISPDNKFVVNIEEVSPNTGIKGTYKAYTIAFDAPANQTTTYTRILPNNVSVINGQISVRNNMEGDRLTLRMLPDTVIGVLTADVSIGDSIINVSNTVLKALQLGYNVTLSDGVNTFDGGEVTNINTGNNTITIENVSTYVFSASTPTYVKMSIVYADIELGVAGYVVMGAYKIGTVFVPMNTPLVWYYTNTSPSIDKRVVMYMETIY